MVAARLRAWALSFNAENTNTLNMDLSFDLLGIEYEPIPAYRGLKEVETAVLQDIGRAANTSLSGWTPSVVPTMGNIVLPLWQLSLRHNGAYPRSAALPNMPTFEEFYAAMHPGKSLSDNLEYRTLRTLSDPQLAMFRVAVMPPNTPDPIAGQMRAVFADMSRDKNFLTAYVDLIKAQPIMIGADEGEEVLAGLAKVPSDIKTFTAKYISNMTAKQGPRSGRPLARTPSSHCCRCGAIRCPAMRADQSWLYWATSAPSSGKRSMMVRVSSSPINENAITVGSSMFASSALLLTILVRTKGLRMGSSLIWHTPFLLQERRHLEKRFG